jgi:hypothetical protein
LPNFQIDERQIDPIRSPKLRMHFAPVFCRWTEPAKVSQLYSGFGDCDDNGIVALFKLFETLCDR